MLESISQWVQNLDWSHLITAGIVVGFYAVVETLGQLQTLKKIGSNRTRPDEQTNAKRFGKLFSIRALIPALRIFLIFIAGMLVAAHPSLVPEAGTGHGPFPMALISEPPLTGIGKRIPDFVWLARDSLNFSPILIEIESPSKRWFTRAGVPHHDLTQAVNQLAEWHAWLNHPENVLMFMEQFQIPDYIRRRLNFRPRFILIYGRRQEFDESPELSRLRAQFERHDQEVMTFDRLQASEHGSIYISATKIRDRYRALAVPATFQLSPMIAEDLSLIEGIPEAIRANDWISPERKDFLIERLAYWNDWCRNERRGVLHASDWE